MVKILTVFLLGNGAFFFLIRNTLIHIVVSSVHYKLKKKWAKNIDGFVF